MSAMPMKVRIASRSVLLLIAIAVLTLFSPIMYAAVVIDIVESNGNVVATAAGSINTAGLIKIEDGEGPLTSVGLIYGSSFSPDFDWDASAIILGSTSSLTLFRGMDEAPFVFSTGSLFEASSASGDLIGALSGIIPSESEQEGTFILDSTYVSGTPLSTTATWSEQTITSMSLIPGSYVFTWGTDANADSLTVNIDGVTPAPTFTVGGTVSGFTESGGAITLQNNGGDDIIQSGNTGFTFPAQAQGSTFAVTVLTESSGRTCNVSNGSGTIANANVTNVAVTCTDDVVEPPPPPPSAAPATPIPTLSQWALVLLTMLLGLMVFSNRGRLFR